MAKFIIVKNVLGGMLSTNCYTLVNQESREALIIDPAARGDFLIKQCADQNYKPVGILLTHGHFDHIGGLKELIDYYKDIKVYAGADEADLLARPEINLSNILKEPISTKADVYVNDGDELELLGTKIKCLHVPGHTKGGICYYVAEENAVFSGDTLFSMSVGRSDFPTGDGEELLRSIEEKLFTLPEDTDVYPGHDSKTTIKKEKSYNPYF